MSRARDLRQNNHHTFHFMEVAFASVQVISIEFGYPINVTILQEGPTLNLHGGPVWHVNLCGKRETVVIVIVI